jgi:hypothetical protein
VNTTVVPTSPFLAELTWRHEAQGWKQQSRRTREFEAGCHEAPPFGIGIEALASRRTCAFGSSPRKPSAGEPLQVKIEKVVDWYLEIPDDDGGNERRDQNRIERVEEEIQWMPLYLGGALSVPSKLQVGTHAGSPPIYYCTR